MESCPDFANLTSGDYLTALYHKIRKANIPFEGSVELTERCNLRCVHCYLGDQDALRHNRTRELDADQWCAILDQLAAAGCLKLLITGGDPMLRKDFAAIYRHAKELGLLVTIFTNGTLITDSVCELFKELPPYRVEITLYGATAESYEEVTGIPGSFARCWAGIEKLRAANIELGLKAVLLKQNVHEFDQLAEQAKTYGTHKFRFDVEVQAGFERNLGPLAIRLDPEDAVRIELSDSVQRDYYLRRFDERLAPNEARIYHCGAGTSTFHINPYGALQPCLLTRHLTFNLSHGSFIEGWQYLQDKLSKRLAPSSFACNSCENRMICNSCPATAMHETGIEAAPTPSHCQTTQVRAQTIRQLIKQAETLI